MLMLRQIPKLSFVTLFLVFILVAGTSADDWPHWMGPTRDGNWDAKGTLKSFPKDGLKPVWRTPIGSGFSGPSVVGDRVFVTDFVTEKGQHSNNPGKRSDVYGKERVLCLDRTSGKIIWKKEYDCHYQISYSSGPRATPTVDDNMVYVMGAEGNFYCLSADDGSEVWKKDFKREYKATTPIWGFSAHPLIVGERLYCVVGGPASVAVAFDKKTGKELWRALDAKNQGYCPPVMVEAGGTQQLLVFHPEALNSLDPETGKMLWSYKMKPAYEMSIIAPIKHKDYLLTIALQKATLLLKLDPKQPKAEEIWRGKGTNPDHNPPVVHDGHIYGVDVNGRIRCVELVTGERKWESLAACTKGRPAPSTTGFIVKNGDHWYIATEQGELLVAEMDPQGFKELGRMKMLDPTSKIFNRDVVWSHPAFASGCVFARNDKEIVCYSLTQ